MYGLGNGNRGFVSAWRGGMGREVKRKTGKKIVFDHL